MKKIYIDSSVIVALLLKERSSKEIRSFLSKYSDFYSSSLLEAEVYASAKREKVKLELATSLISPISLIYQERSLKLEYELIFSMGYSRGADAFHIATCLSLDPSKSYFTFFTLDENQAQLAKKIELKTHFISSYT